VNSKLPVLRFLPWVALAASAALIYLLAQRHHDLSRAYTELSRRMVTLHAGDVVPTFRTSTLDGIPVTIGAAGAPEARQVVFIFRTTCPFCRATLPVWSRIADSLRGLPDPPIELLAISLDSVEPTRAYVRANGLPYPVLLFPEPKLARLYRATAVPLTLVLNGEGRVLYARTGLLDSAAALDSVFHAATARRQRDMAPLTASRTAARGR